MSIFSLRVSNVSRKGGSSSCSTLAYITGRCVHDERNGKYYCYGHEDRVVEVGTRIPPEAPRLYADPARLFNSLEQVEKQKNARVAKLVMAALPLELNREQMRQVIDEFIFRNFVSRGYPAVYAIHEDPEKRNPHVHILVADRSLGEMGEWGKKRSMAYVLDEKGERVPRVDPQTGKQKTDRAGRKQWKRYEQTKNPMDSAELVPCLRESWEKVCNQYLDAAHQIDRRSFLERGIEKEPTIHEGRAARKREMNGKISERCRINREIKERNREREMKEQKREKKRTAPEEER